MTRLVFMTVALFTQLALGESVNVTTGFAVGDSGLNVSVPGFGPNIQVKNNGNGQYQADFSILKSLNADAVPSRIIRVNPAPGNANQLTDSDTFFKGIGGPQPVLNSASRPVLTTP